MSTSAYNTVKCTYRCDKSTQLVICCPLLSPRGEGWARTQVTAQLYSTSATIPLMWLHTVTLHCNTWSVVGTQRTQTCASEKLLYYKRNWVFDPTWHPWLKFVTATMSGLLAHIQNQFLWEHYEFIQLQRFDASPYSRDAVCIIKLKYNHHIVIQWYFVYCCPAQIPFHDTLIKTKATCLGAVVWH